MLLLHAAFADGRLLLWGETPAHLPERNGKAKSPPHYPYDAGSDALRPALTETVDGFKYAVTEEWHLWAPTGAKMPLPSSPLIAESPAEPLTLKPWRITVVPLGPVLAIDFLTAVVGQDVLRPGLIVGSTLAYWATALRFAGALVAAERFLPGLTGERAVWQPVIAGTDKQRVAQLAKAMPAACQALTVDSDQPPVDAAPTLLASFLDVMVDALVRPATLGELVPVETTAPSRRQQGAKFASAHDQWLAGLRSVDGELTGTAPDSAGLPEQIEQWQRPVTAAATAPFRLCFRLEEPADEEAAKKRPAPNGWYLRYLLQGTDDPSLLVPAADAWSPRKRAADPFRKSAFDAREYLYGSLGQAAALCPPIVDSLKAASPAGQPLDATGAHGFLTERAWLLEQAGFGVMLPAWWTRKGTKLRLSAQAQVASPSFQGNQGMRLDEVLTFDWRIALGGETLSREELELLARLKEPLVKVRGQWVQLSGDEIQAALAFWKNKGESRATVRDIVRMALGDAMTPGGLEFGGVTASGWIDEMLKQLEGQAGFTELPAPVNFQGTLRPYQLRGYSWLSFLRRWGLGACLADDMGLGKTVQTLALVQSDWAANGQRPTLLVCPMSVVGNWQKEAERFTPDLPVLVHHGGERIKDAAFRAEASDKALVLSSYALLHRDFELFKGVPWAGFILDEAQNIKNPQTKQAQAARALPADYRIALTGTPVENHVGDLWSLLEFLNPGFLGNRAEFKRKFFVPIQANQDPDALSRLKRLTGPFILRRLKTDKTIISDLPDKLEMKVFCTLTREQASLYAAVVEETDKALRGTDGIKRKGVVLATISKLKQVCNHPAQFLGDNSPIPDRSGKLARLSEMLEEVLQEGDRALVFTQFSEMGDILKRHLQESFGREVLFLHGGVSKKQRDAMVSRFQAADGPRIFLLSLKAGGTGLNLTAANHVFHFDRWWNPAVENQATDRAFRIGQTRNVQVHKFLCVGTLEEKIDHMIERKEGLAKKVVGTGEGWLTELSDAQLKDLFTLRREALGE